MMNHELVDRFACAADVSGTALTGGSPQLWRPACRGAVRKGADGHRLPHVPFYGIL